MKKETKEEAGKTADARSMMKGNAPMLATLRIKELDKLVARLKQNSANCLKAIQLDEQELYHIDREISKIKARYDPLCLRLNARKAERAELIGQHDQVATQVSQLLTDSKARVRKSNNQTVRQLREFANQEVTAARGYSLGAQRSTTTHATGR